MSSAGRVVILLTSPRVAPGLLSDAAWQALHAGPVLIDPVAGAAVEVLGAAGCDVRLIPARQPTIPVVLIEAAGAGATATWWAGSDPDPETIEQLGPLGEQAGITVEVVRGSWDLPGAHVLDVVSTMDRLRSPGGCPWDAKQDHASLAPYLLEEAYEAFQAIEDGDLASLSEELGDVLLQVAFHSRLAAELPPGLAWTIDDVADGLVDKLVRRHPHVFGDVAVADADEVNANWEAIKARERGAGSALASVPMAAAALTLAATLQRKAERAGLVDMAAVPLRTSAASFDAAPSAATAGELLWSAVAMMRAHGIDAETALRARCRDFRDGH